MSDKKDFVPFLTEPHQFMKRTDPSARRRKILKTTEDKLPRHIQMMKWDEINEEKPDVQIIENNGRVEAIQVTCKCGGSVLLEFDYSEPEKTLN